MRKLMFDESFDKDLDPKLWRIREGSKWHNKELQAYSKSNIRTENSELIITATIEDYDDKHYISGRLDTYKRFEFMYGKVDVVAKVPKAIGSWPAIWLLGSNYYESGWPGCGEIDILECAGNRKNEVCMTAHTKSNNFKSGGGKSKVNLYQDLYDKYHKFSIDWTKDFIKWYVDDVIAFEIKKEDYELGDWPFDNKFYLIMNLAVGGIFTDGVVNPEEFPEEFKIKSVKVWSLDES